MKGTNSSDPFRTNEYNSREQKLNSHGRERARHRTKQNSVHRKAVSERHLKGGGGKTRIRQESRSDGSRWGGRGQPVID